jgi:hypothetical protein
MQELRGNRSDQSMILFGYRQTIWYPHSLLPLSMSRIAFCFTLVSKFIASKEYPSIVGHCSRENHPEMSKAASYCPRIVMGGCTGWLSEASEFWTKTRWWFERWENVRAALIFLDRENELIFSSIALRWETQMKSVCSDKSTKSHFLGGHMKVRLDPNGENWLWISEWIRHLIIEHFLETWIGALLVVRSRKTAEEVSKSFRLGSRLSSLKHHKQFITIHQQELQAFGGVDR